MDSEVVRFRSWQRIFEEHGKRYTLESYSTRFGTIGGPDPLDELTEALGRPIDRDALRAARDRLNREWLGELSLREGIDEYLRGARERGLAIGVVSTDERDYVLDSLGHLGLRDGWDVICTADGDPARAKPSPVLYLEALDALAIRPHQAIAFEDSPNGVTAATSAGLFCVAVEHRISAELDLTKANAVIRSFVERALSDVIREAEELGGGAP